MSKNELVNKYHELRTELISKLTTLAATGRNIDIIIIDKLSQKKEALTINSDGQWKIRNKDSEFKLTSDPDDLLTILFQIAVLCDMKTPDFEDYNPVRNPEAFMQAQNDFLQDNHDKLMNTLINGLQIALPKLDNFRKKH